MPTENIWQSSVNLTNRITQVTSGLKLPKGDYWSTLVVTMSLHQANARLHWICVMLNEGDLDNAEILTRSLFELEVNLSYISKDIKNRLPKYLQHGGFPLTMEEVEQAKAKLKGGKTDVKGIVPKQPWKPLRAMCSDLDLDSGRVRVKEYETFYAYASVPTHAGAFTLGASFMRLLPGRSPTDWQRAAVLLTAIEFHLRVTEIAAQTFPKQIAIKRVEELHKECSSLSAYLKTKVVAD